jgi:hypothetical protein
MNHPREEHEQANQYVDEKILAEASFQKGGKTATGGRKMAIQPELGYDSRLSASGTPPHPRDGDDRRPKEKPGHFEETNHVGKHDGIATDRTGNPGQRQGR